MQDEGRTRDGVPEDYPGRVVEFPGGSGHVVMAQLGVQGDDPQAHAAFATALLELAATADGPRRIERGHGSGPGDSPVTVMMLYATDPAAWSRWWSSEAVRGWWRGLDVSGRIGWWREVVSVPAERFNYAAGTEDRVASAAMLPLRPCATFGYWGAYRDRLAASAYDDFASPLAAAPPQRERETRGRRLTVSVPDNLCFIREGQGWGNCSDEERRIWDEQMNDVVGEWVARLGADPRATGCLAIRDLTELDARSGAPDARRSQLAVLLSLGHIERAARTDPAHLAVHRAFVRMYTEPRFTPRMHVWVEVAVARGDEVETEYVNCHPLTGLLPYFDVSAVD